MIIVVSSDPATVKALSANQANGPVSPFGARRTLGLYNPPLGNNENLFLVADLVTFDASQAPAMGDITGVWTVKQLMSHVEDVFPSTYGGNVYFAAHQVDQRGSCWDFAGMFKTLLTSEVRLTGDVYFHPGSLLGPIPAPGDSRWRAVRAIPLVASPVATGPLQEGQPANPMILQSTSAG